MGSVTIGPRSKSGRERTLLSMSSNRQLRDMLAETRIRPRDKAKVRRELQRRDAIKALDRAHRGQPPENHQHPLHLN